MIALAVPVVLSELGWVAQGVVDNIMVGRLGPVAIGAVALGNAVYYTPALFGIGLLLGLDTLVAQAYGRRDHDECHRWLAQGVYLACIVTPPIMILLVAASYGFTRFGVIPEVAVLSGGYLRILSWGTLPLLLYGGTRRYLQGVGQVRVITLTYVVGNLLNWFGNWVLIYGKLGFPALGRERLGDFNVRCACGNGSSHARIRVELRTHARSSAVCALGWAGTGSSSTTGADRRARSGADSSGSWRVEPQHIRSWLSDAGGAGDAYHRAELREHLVHGPAWSRCGCGGECRARDWSR